MVGIWRSWSVSIGLHSLDIAGSQDIAGSHLWDIFRRFGEFSIEEAKSSSFHFPFAQAGTLSFGMDSEGRDTPGTLANVPLNINLRC